MKNILTTVVKSTVRLFGLNITRGYSSWHNPYAKFGISRRDFTTEGKRIVYLKKAKIQIDAVKHIFFLESYSTVVQLVDRAGAEFLIIDEKIIINISGVKYNVLDKVDLFIIGEIFLEGVYNINNLKSDSVLIDIGMNVGITSIYFASRSEVVATYSYEPFLPTFECAKKNISLNNELSAKIKSFNIGLAKSDSVFEVEYNAENKGGMSMYGASAGKNLKSVSKQTIIVKNANDIFQQIQGENPNNTFICKMDCEGAEFEIIETLKNGQALAIPDFYMIEWHNRNPSEIIRSFSEIGYYVLQTTFSSGNVGMIYAFRASEVYSLSH